jgi:hypothetical protein
LGRGHPNKTEYGSHAAGKLLPCARRGRGWEWRPRPVLLASPVSVVTAGTRSARSWPYTLLGADARSVGRHHGEAYRVQVRYACEDLTLLRLRTFKGDVEKMRRGRLPKIALIAAVPDPRPATAHRHEEKPHRATGPIVRAWNPTHSRDGRQRPRPPECVGCCRMISSVESWKSAKPHGPGGRRPRARDPCRGTSMILPFSGERTTERSEGGDRPPATAGWAALRRIVVPSWWSVLGECPEM